MNLINNKWFVSIRFITVFCYLIFLGCALYPGLYGIITFLVLLMGVVLWIVLCFIKQKIYICNAILNKFWILMVLLFNFFYSKEKTRDFDTLILVFIVLYFIPTIFCEILPIIRKRKDNQEEVLKS